MARINKDGKYILSAGEVGIYTICPESWRLRVIKGLKGEEDASVQLGSSLHKDWAAKNEELDFFRRGVRVLLVLISLAIIGAIIHVIGGPI